MNLKSLMGSLFQEAWIVAGKPLVRIYEPVSEWTLPAGVVFNEFNNRFVDEDDLNVTVDPDEVAPYKDVKYVPGDTHKFPNMGFAASPANWDAELYLLTTAEDDLRDCWGVKMPDGFYQIERVLLRPEAMPLMIVATLVKTQKV